MRMSKLMEITLVRQLESYQSYNYKIDLVYLRRGGRFYLGGGDKLSGVPKQCSYLVG